MIAVPYLIKAVNLEESGSPHKLIRISTVVLRLDKYTKNFEGMNTDIKLILTKYLLISFSMH